MKCHLFISYHSLWLLMRYLDFANINKEAWVLSFEFQWQNEKCLGNTCSWKLQWTNQFLDNPLGFSKFISVRWNSNRLLLVFFKLGSMYCVVSGGCIYTPNSDPQWDFYFVSRRKTSKLSFLELKFAQFLPWLFSKHLHSILVEPSPMTNLVRNESMKQSCCYSWKY